MPWATLLHFYQPHGQKREIIDAITAQCYRPVAEGLLARDGARLTVNFTGVLLDQLHEYGHDDVIELWVELVRQGKVELVSSAKYHVILPLLPPAEARRQIEINDATNRRFFGEFYQPCGIFLPEMAWSPELAPLLEELGFEWVVLDELAYNGRLRQVDYTQTYRLAGSQLKAVFREHRLSATIMSAAPRDVEALKDAARADLGADNYVVTAMDGETFGHHRVGHEQLLFGMADDPAINLVGMSELFQRFPKVAEVKTQACTWASSEDDLAKGIPYISWDDPANDIHRQQWQIIRLAAQEMERAPVKAPGYQAVRAQLDWAISSDQLFWAAARPWWMIEHIERGAHDLAAVVEDAPGASAAAKRRAHELYREILDTAYDWQRGGKIDDMHQERVKRVRVPFRERTVEAGDQATWRAILHLLRDQEAAARDQADYEAAILWRDAAYKLEHKLDIYDAWYVIDLLQARLPRGAVEQTIERYRAQFDRLRGGQVEQRSN